jgi:hypothetical protein
VKLDRMVVERYSHVMHIVSNVEGVLKPGLTSIDVARGLPAGTSGAPKVRAMNSTSWNHRPRCLRGRGGLHQSGRHGHGDCDPHGRDWGRRSAASWCGIVHDSVPERMDGNREQGA